MATLDSKFASGKEAADIGVVLSDHDESANEGEHHDGIGSGK